MESDFSIHHSFWYFLNPFVWTRRSLIVAFIAFYSIVIPAYFIIGFHPATAVSAPPSYAHQAPTTSVHLSIPSISLDEPIVDVPLTDSHLATPDYSVGRYVSSSGTTLLFAHSITAFRDLHLITSDDLISYAGTDYHVVGITTEPTEGISMQNLLDASEDTLILMTCAGEKHRGNYTHRLIITAETF